MHWLLFPTGFIQLFDDSVIPPPPTSEDIANFREGREREQEEETRKAEEEKQKKREEYMNKAEYPLICFISFLLAKQRA